MARASSGITTELPGFSWALAVFEEKGVEQEKERKAMENPMITPNNTRLKIKKFFDDNLWVKFINIRSCFVMVEAVPILKSFRTSPVYKNL
jgi:hypothetical protein